MEAPSIWCVPVAVSTSSRLPPFHPWWLYLLGQVRYTCRTKDSTPEPSIEQAAVVKKLCKEDRCDTITPGRDLFGDTECPGKNLVLISPSCIYPGVNDESMLMWIIYSCEGGTDETKTNIPTCKTDKTRCDQSYSCTQKKTCDNAGGFCK